MKIILILIGIALSTALTSYSQIKKGFNIYGIVRGLKNGEKVILMIKHVDKVDTIGSAIVHNSSFEIKNVRLPVYPDFYLLGIQTEFVEPLKLFLGQDGDLKIKGELNNWPNVAIVGSNTHQDYLACKKLRRELMEKDFLLKYPQEIADADTINMYMLKECKEMIRQRPDSYYLAYWLATMKNPVEDMYPRFKVWPDKKKELYDMLSPKAKESRYGQILGKQIEHFFVAKERETQLRTAAEKMSSITHEEALGELRANANKKVEIKRLKTLDTKLTKTQLKAKLEEATVIVSMAFPYPGTDEIQFNPTTAYVIDELGICVSNYHVGKEYASKPYLSLSISTKEGKSYPVVRILSSSESDDLMIFQVDTNGDKLESLSFGNTVAKGSLIHVMGHPKRNYYSFSSGEVSGYSTSTLANQPCNIMGITADFTVGSSGGPIVDDFGNIVGTVSRVDAGMKVGIPVSELKKLLVFK